MQNRIQEWRKRRGLTLEELAPLCDTSPQQINRLELSTRRLSDKWLARLSTALSVPKASLLIDDFVPPSPTPREGDFAKNDTERRLLNFWRALSPQAQDFILETIDRWADRFGAGDE